MTACCGYCLGSGWVTEDPYTPGLVCRECIAVSDAMAGTVPQHCAVDSPALTWHAMVDSPMVWHAVRWASSTMCQGPWTAMQTRYLRRVLRHYGRTMTCGDVVVMMIPMVGPIVIREVTPSSMMQISAWCGWDVSGGVRGLVSPTGVSVPVGDFVATAGPGAVWEMRLDMISRMVGEGISGTHKFHEFVQARAGISRMVRE